MSNPTITAWELLTEVIDETTSNFKACSAAVMGGLGTAKKASLLGKKVTGVGFGNLFAAADEMVNTEKVVKDTADGSLPDNNALRTVEKEAPVADLTPDHSCTNTKGVGVHETIDIDMTECSRKSAVNEKGIGLKAEPAGKLVKHTSY